VDTELLVDNRTEDGRKLLAELAQDGFDVTVAFWVKTSEEGLWSLYIGSPAVNAKELGNAYRRIYACLSRIPEASIALSEIKLINSQDPLAQAATSQRDRYAWRLATRYQGSHLGPLSIEEAYFYPSARAPMSRNDVLQTVAALMNRTGALHPASFTLRDGSSIQAIPVGIDMKLPGTVHIVVRDITSNIERQIPADDVENIL